MMEFDFHSKNCDQKLVSNDLSVFSECVYK